MCPNNGVRFGAYLLRVSMGTEGRELCRRQEQTGKVLADPVFRETLREHGVCRASLSSRH